MRARVISGVERNVKTSGLGRENRWGELVVCHMQARTGWGPGEGERRDAGENASSPMVGDKGIPWGQWGCDLALKGGRVRRRREK